MRMPLPNEYGTPWVGDVHWMQPMNYERTLYRLGAYWDMGQSVLTPREVIRNQLDSPAPEMTWLRLA